MIQRIKSWTPQKTTASPIFMTTEISMMNHFINEPFHAIVPNRSVHFWIPIKTEHTINPALTKHDEDDYGNGREKPAKSYEWVWILVQLKMRQSHSRKQRGKENDCQSDWRHNPQAFPVVGDSVWEGAREFWKYHSTRNKWRGVTISLRTAGQGHPTPINIPTPPHTHKSSI